jgi:PAS domain S-box-containing protein
VKLTHPVANLRDTLLNEALIWLCVVSLPSVAISLARMQTTGWLPLFGYQLFLLSLLWLCWFGRRHIAYHWRVGVILFVLGTSGLGGYLQYGPFAIAGRFLLLFLVIAALFLSGRAALWNAVLMLAGLLLIALGAVNGVLQFQSNAFTDTNGAISWALTIFATFAYGGLVAMIVWRLIHILTGYQGQLMQANETLEIKGQALAESESFVRATMDTLSSSLAILDENGTIIGVNRAWRQIAETGNAEPARVSEGVNYLAVCDRAAGTNAAGAAEMAAGIRQVLQGERDEYVQESQWKSPQKVQWLFSRVARVPTASGTRAIVTHEDITALWDAESEVRNLTRAVEQSPAAVLITDHLGNIEYVNPQFEQVTGYNKAEVLGKNPRIFKSGQTSAETYRAIWGAISVGGKWRGELRNRKKSGELIWVDASLSGVKDRDGHIAHFIGVYLDVTASKQAAQALQDARRQELEVGAIIQRTLVSEVPDGIEGAWLAKYADPSQVIDGDFAFVHRFSPGCFEVLVGDVMGKGVQAALMGAGIITAYHRALAELLVNHANAPCLPTPAGIINAIHRDMAPQLYAISSFATLALYRFDLDAGKLTYVSAGHTPGLLMRGRGAPALTILGDNLPIGVLAEENYLEFSMDISPGDSLLVFSDGITEARSPQGEEFGLARLSELMEQANQASLPPSTTLQALRGAQRRFTGGGPGTDDLTAVMVTVQPRRGMTNRVVGDRIAPLVFSLPWRLEGLGDLRARITDCATNLSEDAAAALILASFEAATNIIRHAPLMVGDATLTCRITRESDAVVVELIYPSEAFTPPAELDPDMSGASEGGFGLYIIEQSVDSVEYSSIMPGVASIRLVKHA